jgi:hypothetical protein
MSMLKSWRKRRTLVLGLTATAGLAWMAIDTFGVAPAELGWLLLYCVAAVVVVVCAAAVFVALIVLFRRLIGRG